MASKRSAMRSCSQALDAGSRDTMRQRALRRCVARPGVVPGRQGLAGEPPDFERALDALRVGRRQARGGGRVDAGKLGMQRRPAARGGLGIDARAHPGIGLGHGVQAFAQGLEVQHRAADQQGQVSALRDLVDEPPRVGHEARRGIGLRRIEDVDQVVRHLGALGSAGLGGADVHAAVDEGRIDADDLHRPLARHGARKGHRHRRLAAGRGPGQAQCLRCHSVCRCTSVQATSVVARDQNPMPST